MLIDKSSYNFCFIVSSLSRKPSFLERAKHKLTPMWPQSSISFSRPESNGLSGVVPGIAAQKRRLSRRTSFLESRPIRSLTKLTRR